MLNLRQFVTTGKTGHFNINFFYKLALNWFSVNLVIGSKKVGDHSRG